VFTLGKNQPADTIAVTNSAPGNQSRHLRCTHGLENPVGSEMHWSTKIQPDDNGAISFVTKYLRVGFAGSRGKPPVHCSQIVSRLIKAGFIVLDATPFERRQVGSDSQRPDAERGEIQSLAGRFEID
jgi:hypothetical protein